MNTEAVDVSPAIRGDHDRATIQGVEQALMVAVFTVLGIRIACLDVDHCEIVAQYPAHDRDAVAGSFWPPRIDLRLGCPCARHEWQP